MQLDNGHDKARPDRRVLDKLHAWSKSKPM